MLQISIIPSVNHVKVILETYAQLDLTDANSSIKISTQFSQVVIVKETISLVNRGQRKKKSTICTSSSSLSDWMTSETTKIFQSGIIWTMLSVLENWTKQMIFYY